MNNPQLDRGMVMRRQLKSGFTLIELLVVISIILIASSIIFVGGNSGDGAALGSAQRIVSGIAQGARGQAILKNANVRLIIHNDPAEFDKYRRFFGIVYEDPEIPGFWIAATQGTYLPEGIFFDAASSASVSDSSWTTRNEMNLNYPRASGQREGQGSSYYYYGFNSNGTAANPNAYLILAAGTAIPNASGNVQRITVEPDQEALRSGLIVRRTGTVTRVDEPSALPSSGGGNVSEIR